MLKEQLVKKVNEQIKREYGFDTEEILTDDAIIFGGIIRDILTEGNCTESKDIDIIMSASRVNYVETKLMGFGYKRNQSLEKLETEVGKIKHQKASQYDNSKFDLRIYTIQQTHRIDLVMPKMEEIIAHHSFMEGFITDLISNLVFLQTVDFSCSMIGYNKHFGIIANEDKAFKMLDKKIFTVNTNSILYNETRSKERIKKLEDKGWMKI